MWPSSSPASLLNGAAGMTITALVIAALYFGANLFIPLALAGVFSFILQPLVGLLHSRFIPRPLAILSVVFATTLILGIAGSFLAREASYLAAELPKYEINLREKAKAATSALHSVGIWYNATRMFERVEAELKTPTEAPPIKVAVQQEEFQSLAALLMYAKLTLSPLATLGLTFLFTIFILLQYYDLRDRLVYLFGPAEIGRTTQAFNEAAVDLSRFFRLQAGLNLGFGIVVGFTLWLVGLPNPVLWGALAGISRFVPYIGGIVAAVGPLLMAASVDPGWTTFFATGLVILIAETLIGYAIEPLLFGAKTRMSPLAVLAAAAFWTAIWGPIGLILALPITLAIVVFGEHVPRLTFFRVLFGNNPALSAAQRLYHLLLAGHESRAIEEVVRHMAEERPLIDYVDQVFIPAMIIATKDLNMGVFRQEQLDGLKRATEEFIEFFKEVAETQTVDATEPVEKAGRIIVLAGRGSFDQAVAEITAVMLKENKELCVACTSLGGLTGIASAVDPAEPPVRYLAIATVGGVTEAQLKLLCRRAQRDLRPERVAILVGNENRKKLMNRLAVPQFSSIKALRNDLLNQPEPQRETPIKDAELRRMG